MTMKGYAIVSTLLAVVGWVITVDSEPALPKIVPKDLRGYYDYFMENKEDDEINSDLTEMISVKFANNSLKRDRETLVCDIKAIHGLLMKIFRALLNPDYRPDHAYVHKKSSYKPMVHFKLLGTVIPALYERLVLLADIIQSINKKQYTKSNDLVKCWLTDSKQGFDAFHINTDCDTMALQDDLTELIGPSGHLTKVAAAFMSYEKTMGKLKILKVEPVRHSNRDEARQSNSMKDEKEESGLCKTKNPCDIETTPATLHAGEEITVAGTPPSGIAEVDGELSGFFKKLGIAMNLYPEAFITIPVLSDDDALSIILEESEGESLSSTTTDVINMEPADKAQEVDGELSGFFKKLGIAMNLHPEAIITIPEGNLDTSFSPPQSKDKPAPQIIPASTIRVKVVPTSSDEVTTKHYAEPLITRQNVDVPNRPNAYDNSPKGRGVKETKGTIILSNKAHLTINGVKETVYPVPVNNTVETTRTTQMTPESIEEFAKEITDSISNGDKNPDATKDGSKMTVSSGASNIGDKKRPDSFIPITTTVVSIAFLLLI